MIIVSWIDQGELRESRFCNPQEGLDFIMSLRALDFSFTAISVPDVMA